MLDRQRAKIGQRLGQQPTVAMSVPPLVPQSDIGDDAELVLLHDGEEVVVMTPSGADGEESLPPWGCSTHAPGFAKRTPISNAFWQSCGKTVLRRSAFAFGSNRGATYFA